jgi:MinD superfamily P-loop ATPase
MALIVTEPTVSGLHDLTRVAELCRQLRIPAAVCVNKADINLAVTTAIEAAAAKWDIPAFGRIAYDDAVTNSQVQRQAVVAHSGGRAARDLRGLAARVFRHLAGQG